MPISALSDSDDFTALIPGAGDDYLYPAASYTADYLEDAKKAAREIRAYVIKGSAYPPTDPDVLEQLKEVETLLVAHRRFSSLYASRGINDETEYRQNWRSRAMGLLNQIEFPASFTTPAKGNPFSGSHDLGVQVFNDFTASALWSVICTKAGTHSTAAFRVWNRRNDQSEIWDLGSSPTWPKTHPSDDPLCATYQVKLSITENGGDDFDTGDHWTFRTWSRWSRRGRKRPAVRFHDVHRRF